MATDAAAIKCDLQVRIEEVCCFLLPGGRVKRAEYCCGSIEGGAGESFRVHLAGVKAGQWCEFNGRDDKGDVWALIQAVRRCSFVEALDWARDFLGIQQPEFYKHASTPKREYRKPERPTDATRPREGSALDYLTLERRLTAETVKAFQIAEASFPEWANQEDFRGKPALVFPYKRAADLVMVKWIALERDDRGKKAVTTTKDAEPCLFGWQAIPDDARSVVIAEGEIDAATWWQVGYPALSPPRGTGSTDWVDVEYPNLDRFETIYLAYDNDEAGAKAIHALAPRFGERVRIVGHLDAEKYGKDANAWLCAGATEDQFAELIRTARDNRPAELRMPSEYEREVLELFRPTSQTANAGFEPPFGRIAGRIRFRPGEFSLWTGYSHHGKTDMVNFLMVCAASQQQRVCMASLEVAPAKTICRLIRQSSGEKLPSEDRIHQTLVWLSEWFWVFNPIGTASLDRILDVFGYAQRRYGCSQFVIDNLTWLGIGEEDWDAQKAAVRKCAAFTSGSGAHLHLVTHPRKAQDETKPPGKQDIRGHGSLTDLAHNVFVQWRNVKKGEELSRLEAKEDPNHEIPGLVEREEDAMWIVAKQRETGDTPAARLWFDRQSLQFHEQPWQSPHRYIDVPYVIAQAQKTREVDDISGFIQWEDDGDLPF